MFFLVDKISCSYKRCFVTREPRNGSVRELREINSGFENRPGIVEIELFFALQTYIDLGGAFYENYS